MKEYLKEDDTVFCWGCMLIVNQIADSQKLYYDVILNGEYLTYDDSGVPVYYDSEEKKYYFNKEDL